MFYHIWIPHYTHVAEPLYGLLKKGRKFEWQDEHTESVRKMKEALVVAPALRKAVYEKGTPMYITVDTSPTGIGWVVHQEERDVVLHSRPAAGQQSDHPERRNRTDHRRVRGGLRQKVDLLGRGSVLGV